MPWRFSQLSPIAYVHAVVSSSLNGGALNVAYIYDIYDTWMEDSHHALETQPTTKYPSLASVIGFLN